VCTRRSARSVTAGRLFCSLQVPHAVSITCSPQPGVTRTAEAVPQACVQVAAFARAGSQPASQPETAEQKHEAQLKALQGERQALQAERSAIKEARQALQAERARIKAERVRLAAERDFLAQERARLAAERALAPPTPDLKAEPPALGPGHLVKAEVKAEPGTEGAGGGATGAGRGGKRAAEAAAAGACSPPARRVQ
jgi:hypothetical protein